jgi:hypothetical protein
MNLSRQGQILLRDASFVPSTTRTVPSPQSGPGASADAR